MECVLHFFSPDSVLLLNGSFVQTAVSVRYDSREPLFVTVLPLDAANLPYTVELVDGKAVTNSSLAVCCDMGENHRYVELKPRSAYVYSPSTPLPAASTAAPAHFLSLIREGNYSAARELMSKSLSESVTDRALADFFDGVTAVRENVYTPERGYLLIKTDGTAQKCDIEMRGGIIENIVMR